MAPMPGFFSLLSSNRSMSIPRGELRGLRASQARPGGGAHTGDVPFQNVIFLDSVVKYFLGSIVDHQDHPLKERRKR